MGGGPGFGYAEGFEATKGSPAARSTLSPFFAIAIGAWYGLVFASAMSLGLDYVSKSHGTHPYLSSLASALGAGMGAGLCSLLARKWRVVAALLAAVPCAAIWLVVINLGNRKLDPILFEWRPSAFWVGVTFTALTLLCGAVGGFIGVQEVTPDSFGEQLLNVRPRHWFWLWIAAASWVSMIPVAAYYLWLELVTSGYVLVHPSLWFNASWDKDVAFGLMPGMIGIAGLAYGIDLSLRSVAPPKKGKHKKKSRYLSSRHSGTGDRRSFLFSELGHCTSEGHAAREKFDRLVGPLNASNFTKGFLFQWSSRVPHSSVFRLSGKKKGPRFRAGLR